MSDNIQAEMRSDIKDLLVAVGQVRTSQSYHSEALGRLETDMKNLPQACGTGKDHEKRIKALEAKPGKQLVEKSTKIGIFANIGGVLLSVAAIVIAIFFK